MTSLDSALRQVALEAPERIALYFAGSSISTAELGLDGHGVTSKMMSLIGHSADGRLA